MANLRNISLPLLFLALAVATRFISILGIDTSKWWRFLQAYMATDYRAGIFLIQYVGFCVVLAALLKARPADIRAIATATFLLVMVSIARFLFPIFLVSIIGDALVIWWLLRKIKEHHEEKAMPGGEKP